MPEESLPIRPGEPLRAPLPWASPFDRALAQSGPPAVFTVDADGAMRLAPNRTRDAWNRGAGTPHFERCDCLYRDRATGWVQYVLVTSPGLCASHPRADIVRFPSQDDALRALEALGRLPLSTRPIPAHPEP